MVKYSGTLIRSGNNAKTVKGDDEFVTAIMYLAPFTLSGFNVCAMASTAVCVLGCLNSAGRGAFSNVQLARINKTKRYVANRAAFMAELVADLQRFVNRCVKADVKPACRLNGTSDIQWEVAHPCVRDGKAFASIFEAFPEVQFYDYTKIYKRVYRELPANYSLTLSFSGANTAYADAVVKAANETGANVAVVFRSKDSIPSQKWSYFSPDQKLSRPTFGGDATDLRFTDPKGVVVALYAKGAAKKDVSGFVVD